jgi:chemotaxis protein CheC
MQKHLDKINEASKMAAVKASAALSKLIDQPVGVAISPAQTLAVTSTTTYTNAEDQVVGIIAPLSGDLKGISMMVFPKSGACILCDILLHREENETQSFQEMEISALTEVANIVIGNFLGPFASPLNLESVMHHVPHFRADNYQNMIDYITASAQLTIDNQLMVEIVITMQHLKIKGHLILMMGLQEMQQSMDK